MKGLTILRWMAAAAAIALGGCASYGGHGLRPGVDGAGEVRAVMGEPHDRWSEPDGSSTWAYKRGPFGRETFFVRLGPDGKLRGVEQVLTEENFARLQVGKTTELDVLRLIGRPDRVAYYARRNEHDWAYHYRNASIRMLLYITFDGQGVVREVASVLDEPDVPSID